MKVLVTGASGFIGQSLVPWLIKSGHEITCAMRSPKEIPNTKTIVVGEIDSQTDWSEALKNIDAVIHLAARVHVMNEQEQDPLKAFRMVNVEGTQNLVQQAEAANIKRLVFLSSIKVNGEETFDQPFKADDTFIPSDPYGLSKYEAEQILKNSTLETTTIRPPLIYGPGVKANFLAFMKLAQKGWPVPFGGLTNKRSLIYVMNLCSVIEAAMSHPNAANKTYLVSDNHDLSLKEMFTLLAKCQNKKPPIINIPPSVLKIIGQLSGKSKVIHRLVSCLQIDCQPIINDLQWHPPYSVEEGFHKTTQWYLNKLNS